MYGLKRGIMNIHSHTHPHETVTPTRGRIIRMAGQYDFLVNLLLFGREKTFRNNIIRLAAIPKGAAVLDVGCGTGTLALMAKEAVGEQGKVFGIDAAPEMIEVARHKASHGNSAVNFQQGVIEALPFEDGTFDYVLSTLMFHHLPTDLKQQGLAEIYRVLKPNGRLLIIDIGRPTNFIQHVSMAFILHGGLTQGIQDVVPMMKAVGYTGIQSKSGWWGVLGSLQAQRPAN
jgi:ubiquinone/menaquinone biosynthesis C-methylase UbiE